MAVENAQARAGPYLGEISALAFLHLPTRLSSSFPLLLAGTGSQVLVYKLQPRKLLLSFHAFDGVRVHGLTLRTAPSSSSEMIAVYGERRVKLLRVMIGVDRGEFSVGMEVSSTLPRFDHWVLDALFLEVIVVRRHLGQGEKYLAVGLSDNSVAVWDVLHSKLVILVKSRVKRCLLYSMRLWGENVEALRVASGTIFNEIIVWKLAVSAHLSEEDSSFLNSSDFNDVKTLHLGTLVGHNGSIFRIAWNSDGSKLLSVSDDRSARMWLINTERQNDGSWLKLPADQVPNGVSLYGHNARIWDCSISDSVVITAGEDCTCRLWGMDGNQIMMFKEHVGRGIWRCLYDPTTLLLVTAGFDSAIQVHLLPNMCKDSSEADGMLTDSNDRIENFSICTPNVSEKFELMDSKSEYVRCLHFGQEDILYVATNNGYLYHAKLLSPGDVEWTQLAHVGEVPIVCMDLMSRCLFETSKVPGDMIAMGDGKGNATVVRVVGSDSRPKAVLSFTWSAERERRLLGIHWCKSFGCSYVFTADHRGSLNLWRLEDAAQCVANTNAANMKASLVAVYSSSFGKRVMCLDASMKDEVLVCGDQHGNLVIFPLLKNMLLSDFSKSKGVIPSLTQFKGAHGMTSVTSIFIGRRNGHHIEMRTTGGDGCICYFNFSTSSHTMEFYGMKHIRELSIIKIVVDNVSSVEDLGLGHFVLQVPCGGWRRPYSYYLGHNPKTQNCFAFLKDHKIHIRRHWEVDCEEKSFPQILHTQCHGREIHSTCFVSLPMGSKPHQIKDFWVVSGSEDGTVRLTRYAPSDPESWSVSHLLGEHVGGSAVRSVCFVSKMFGYGTGCLHDVAPVDDSSSDYEDNWCMLISVGAKQVLTSWLLRDVKTGNVEEPCIEALAATEDHRSSISFQWLSTHIPPRPSRTSKNRDSRLRTHKGTDTLTSQSAPPLSKPYFSENLIEQTRSAVVAEDDNDWRYLAVTAFVVEDAEIRSKVCFVVVACSDATLTLRALQLPHRLWYGNASDRNAHVIVSGSTDGNITLWDLTRTIEQFMQSMSELQPDKVTASQRRPRTGRGSQGGRWWRSLDHQNPKKGAAHGAEPEISDGGLSPMADKCELLLPLHVLASVHQSGVNCLHVSSVSQHSEESAFCILSGGDDQALSCLFFGLTAENRSVGSSEPQWMERCSYPLVNDYKLKVLYSCKLDSAHSAAVKGIWSDGCWAFSTGLDQRIRFWRIDARAQLTEHAHLIISVPEPESLDAVSHGRSGEQYRIVVAGRGMQMIEFSPQDQDRAIAV
ncbi:unnamed protein product [Spirodela intermedia]|uniref:Uncharacterized protein n=1 Tax=Spirodela intermedia TaxID=51605 RepID=A0A7I8I8E4_SPIIN|nr:unnamed protein product [Spirodela intermedia]CAA6653936.1 unnamed protein product [Spirodela intermedia]